MSFPVVNVHLHTNGCASCGSVLPCGCSSQNSSVAAQTLPSAAVPCNSDDGGCKDAVYSGCMFWDGIDIPEYNIKKGDSFVKIVNILLQEITNLKNA
jgi:hypothetical protein